jgi:hypothetical protein
MKRGISESKKKINQQDNKENYIKRSFSVSVLHLVLFV